MAEAGTPQPDGPRPSTPRSRGDRGRDPAALAAWRRVADQRRRTVDKSTSPADRLSTERPPADRSPVEPPVVEAPGVEAPGVEVAVVADPPASDPPVAEAPVVEAPVAEVDTADQPVVTGRPAAARAGRPAVARSVERRTGSPATTGPAVERSATTPPTDPERSTAARPVGDRPSTDRPVGDRPAADRSVGDRAAADRPAVARPAVARPAVDRPAVGDPADDAAATPDRTATAASGSGDDHVRAVREDRATGEPTGPQTPPTPASEEPAPSATRRSDDGPPSVGRLHDVLLGLAGRLDDDALTSVREMVAAEADAEAAELLGGCLLAGGIGLTGGERAVLRPWFTAARVDPELLGLLPADSGALDRSAHRFVTNAVGRAPGIPLARAARRLTGVVAVRESWRVTPAGTAPGPVPHRVVLVETVGPDDCDLVVHHLAHAARALDDTSVEVFAAGAGLPAYHRDALAVARPLVADDAAVPAAPAAPVRLSPSVPARPSSAPARATPAPTPAERIGAADDEETWQTVADAGTSRTGPSPVPVPPQPVDLEDLEDPVEADADEPELLDADEPEPADADEPEPAVPDETDEAPAARDIEPQPAPPARPAAQDGVSRPAAPPETSIDEDLSSTARRIAALWARPSPEDFSAPLPGDSLEPTRLEPARDDAPAPVEPEDDDEAPSGRHGRPAVADMGTTSFRSLRSRSRTNGHPVPRSPEPAARREDAPATDPAPTTSGDDAADPDSAQLPRTRQRRARDGDASPQPDSGPARFGHDARFGAGPGPAWPGGPVTGETRPGPDTLFTSPVEVGEEPVSFGTNGHRHDVESDQDDEPDTLGTNGHRHDPGVAAADEEPDTGPVAWSTPAGLRPVAPPAGPRAFGSPSAAGPTVVPPPPPAPPAPGYPASGPHPGGPGPRRPGDPGDVTPPWAADEAGWTPEDHPRDGSPAQGPDPSWTPDDDSVAQLSDRERDLLARLHEELAQRERSDGADPFGAPPSGPDRSRPRPPRPGAPGGRVNGHGLPPGGSDGASA